MSENQVILQVKGLSKSFSGNRVVDRVEFEVEKGVIYGLLGPNGAGKTTLLRMIAGVIEPDEGEIRVRGMNPTDPEVRRLIGYAPQDPVVYEDLTGFENLMFYAGLHGVSGSEAKEKCRRLLELVGLSDHSNRLVKTYSGGMRKRLSFAAALIGDPELLILDEPTTGMDPRVRRTVWDIILGERDRAVVLATHYMDEADLLSDRVAIMDRGRIIAEGSPDELKRRYGPKAVVNLRVSGSAESALEAVRSLGLEPSFSREDELRVPVDDPDEGSPKIVSALLTRGIRIDFLKVSRPSLEDVFLKLTGRRLTG